MQTSSRSAAYVPPPGVIEVVSQHWKDDYLTKVAEYEDLGISERQPLSPRLDMSIHPQADWQSIVSERFLSVVIP
ncbi:Uma2 family endonuclease [Trichothermofontia sichuanensis B231]|uniref:Uma2 family endonuclease n=1 Tax=Trichothermofontia sichuanensis TaxID=3045816 RepID=UPI002244FF57|nr:Uma2 family endonuclease [Trichothermofontia sichuanensis]UZQ56003.1 Uma2 family endonuclease [Trichothermofontia sichuanensis B231]